MGGLRQVLGGLESTQKWSSCATVGDNDTTTAAIEGTAAGESPPTAQRPLMKVMTLTARPAKDCVKTASPHSSLWILMDPLWRDSTQHPSSHPGLIQVIACPHHGLLDQQQRKLIPGLFGRFCLKVKANLYKRMLIWEL